MVPMQQSPLKQGRAWHLHPVVLLLWLGSYVLAAALEHAPHASLWFPPAAVSFAALFCAGWRAVPAIFLACVVGTYWAEASNSGSVRPGVLVSSSLVFAVTHTGAYAVPAMLLRRLTGTVPAEATLRAVTQFLLLGALAALLAALLGAAGLRATGLVEAPDLLVLVSAWWIGDYAALVTLAPSLALLLRRTCAAGDGRRFPPLEWGPWRLRGSALQKLALLFAVTVLILVGYLALSNTRALLVMLVLPVVLQLWIVHTESLASSHIGLLGFSLLTVGAAAAFNVGEDALVLQFAAISLAANTYLSLAAPALYAANKRLRAQVSHDALTGAMSRAYFEERASDELGRAARGAARSSLIMLDLDGLKHLNDTRGHGTGDIALRELVQGCRAVLREDGFIGRLGGDEFAIFLPGADAAQAQQVADTLAARLAARPVAAVGAAVSASFGIATSEGPSTKLSHLLHAADEAMYAVKRARHARGP